MDKSVIGQIVEERFVSRYGENRRKAIVGIAYELSVHSRLPLLGTLTSPDGSVDEIDYVYIADKALDGLLNSGTMIWESAHRNKMRTLAADLAPTSVFSTEQLQRMRDHLMGEYCFVASEDQPILNKIKALLRGN